MDDDQLTALAARARAGDLDAYGRLVCATQRMAYAVALSVLRDSGLAEDAVQDAYLRAFRHLSDLKDPAALPAWLRRTAITAALNQRRSRRRTFLRLDDVPEVPVLDEAESTWSEAQRLRLAGALLKLNPDERRLCDPAVHTAIGVGCGLERLAMLRYGIDDIRRVEGARVA